MARIDHVDEIEFSETHVSIVIHNIQLNIGPTVETCSIIFICFSVCGGYLFFYF